MSLRKITTRLGTSPSDEALPKLFRLAPCNISEKWKMPILDSKATVSRFTIQLEERLPQRQLKSRIHKNPHTPPVWTFWIGLFLYSKFAGARNLGRGSLLAGYPGKFPVQFFCSWLALKIGI